MQYTDEEETKGPRNSHTSESYDIEVHSGLSEQIEAQVSRLTSSMGTLVTFACSSKQYMSWGVGVFLLRTEQKKKSRERNRFPHGSKRYSGFCAHHHRLTGSFRPVRTFVYPASSSSNERSDV